MKCSLNVACQHFQDFIFKVAYLFWTRYKIVVHLAPPSRTYDSTPHMTSKATDPVRTRQSATFSQRQGCRLFRSARLATFILVSAQFCQHFGNHCTFLSSFFNCRQQYYQVLHHPKRLKVKQSNHMPNMMYSHFEDIAY